jgi:sugar O-acyltransferase (sialic acid O-acetyltransferase NeuD family)
VRSVVVLGSGVYAEEVADLAAQAGVRVAGFVENWDRDRASGELRGLPVTWIDDAAALAREHPAICGLGTTRRSGFVEQAAAAGFSFATLVHPAAVISPSAVLGEGTIAGPCAVVAAHARIGTHGILNRGALVGHHTVVGDYVTASPAVNVGGCGTIGDRAYLGMGCTVLDRRSVGAGALVGAGAVVTRDVAEATKVMGVPARVVAEGIEPR